MIGGKFGVKTVISMVLCSAFIDGLLYLLPELIVTKDVIVSAVFGSSVIGTGIVLVIIAGAITGGTDKGYQLTVEYGPGQLFISPEKYIGSMSNTTTLNTQFEKIRIVLSGHNYKSSNHFNRYEHRYLYDLRS